MQLTDKTAVIYGAAGSIGSAVAKAFAAEGATVVLAGRTPETLAALAAEIGDAAHVAPVDALDRDAVDAHAQQIVDRHGAIDISLNLVTRGDVQGIPLTQMSAEDLLRPVTNGLQATFNTATAAARHMAATGGGVILSLTSGSTRGSAPMMGGTGPADAAMETFLRYLAQENGAHGVRTAGIHTAAVKGTLSVEKMREVNADAPAVEQIDAAFQQMTMLGRRPTLDDVTGAAVFLASDRAAGTTSAILNVTCGLVAG